MAKQLESFFVTKTWSSVDSSPQPSSSFSSSPPSNRMNSRTSMVVSMGSKALPFQTYSRTCSRRLTVCLYSNPNPPNSGYNGRDDAWMQSMQQRRASVPNPPSSQEEEMLAKQRWEAEVMQGMGGRRGAEEGSRPASPSSSPRTNIIPQDVSKYDNNGATASSSSPSPSSFSRRDPSELGFARLFGMRAIWILSPILLLLTAALPAICLPVTYLFSGSALAGLLALLGLDGFFNIGATAYLLMSSASAEAWVDTNLPCGADVATKYGPNRRYSDIIPRTYRLWSWAMNISGLMIPVIGLMAACAHGHILTRSDLLPVLAMLGPYLFILFVQTVAESLVRLWESPVWPVLPLVYQSYRIVQLARAVDLGMVLAAPNWLTVGIKMMAGWWVMVIAMQAMWLVRFIALLKRI